MLTSLLNILMLADVLFIYKCTGNEITYDSSSKTYVTNECACFRSNEPITSNEAAWNAALAYLNKHEPTYPAGITTHSVTPWVADMTVGDVTTSVIFGYHCEYKTSARTRASNKDNCVDFCYYGRKFVCDVQEIDDSGCSYGTAVDMIVKETVFTVFTSAVSCVSADVADSLIADNPNNCSRITLGGISQAESLPVFSNPRLVPGFVQASSVKEEPTVWTKAIKKVKSWWTR